MRQYSTVFLTNPRIFQANMPDRGTLGEGKILRKPGKSVAGLSMGVLAEHAREGAMRVNYRFSRLCCHSEWQRRVS